MRQGAGIVKSGSAPTSEIPVRVKVESEDRSGKERAGSRQKDVKECGGKSGRENHRYKGCCQVVGAAVIGGGAVAGYNIHQAKRAESYQRRMAGGLHGAGLENGVMTQGLSSLT